MKKIIKKNRRLFLAFSVIFLVALFSLTPLLASQQFAHAADSGDPTFEKEIEELPPVCDDWGVHLSKVDFGQTFKCILISILRLGGRILGLTGVIFTYVVDANQIKLILANPAIYLSWTTVRDFFNMAFILVLLYAAFCQIFQIEKFAAKNILLKLVIMALLVNFSFPIARFFVDVSNVAMYTILRDLFTYPGDPHPGYILTKIADQSALGEIIYSPSRNSAASSFLEILTSVIFVFIFALTILVLAAMLLIRLVALVILIIFSPIAFVGAIIPNLSKYSDDWWENMFKYAFFGPVMAFLLVIATQIMGAMINKDALRSFARENAPPGPQQDLIASIAQFSIPIVILWAGMLTAQKMGIEGSGIVTGYAKKIATGAGKKFSGYNWMSQQYKDFKKERDTRKEEARWKVGKNIGEKFNKSQDALFAKARNKKSQKRIDENERKKVQATREEWKKMGGASDAQLDSALKGKDSAKRKAAAMELAEKKGFKDLAQFQSALKAIKGDAVYEKLFNDKAEEKHIKFIIENDISSGIPAVDAYKNRLDLSPDQMAKQIGLHETIATNADFENYVTTNIVPDTDYHKEFFKKLTKKQREAYIAKGLNP